MRNVVLAVVALDVAGTYAAYVKLNQPVAVDFALDEPAAAIADADIGLPPVQASPSRQFALAKMPPLPPAIRLQPIDIIPDAPEAPIVDAEPAAPKLAAAPVEPKMAVAPVESRRASLRLAAWSPSPRQVSTRPSKEFSAAFAATDTLPADAPPSLSDAGPSAHAVDQAARDSARVAALSSNVIATVLPLTELPAPVADAQPGSDAPQPGAPSSASIPSPDFGTGQPQSDVGGAPSAPVTIELPPVSLGTT
jgi:hypothetical protein